MKKILLGLTAVIITFSAMAQKGKGKGNSNKEWKQEKIEKKEERKEEKHEDRKHEDHSGHEGHDKGDKMHEQLGLTESQRSQMKEINAEFKKQMQELKSSGNMADEQVKEKRKAILKQRHDKIQAVLTDEQKAKFKEAKKDNSDRDHRTGGYKAIKGSNGEGLERMTKGLNLTSEQSAKLQELNKSFTAKVTDIRNNNSLTEQQKKDQIKELANSQRSSVKDILTDEQKKQLRSKMKNHRGGNRVK